jgi:hypothetical protein
MADDKWSDAWIREAYPPNLKICYSLEEIENEVRAYYKSKVHPKTPITLGIPYHVFEPAEDAGKSKVNKRNWFSRIQYFQRNFIKSTSIRFLILMSFQRYMEN